MAREKKPVSERTVQLVERARAKAAVGSQRRANDDAPAPRASAMLPAAAAAPGRPPHPRDQRHRSSTVVDSDSDEEEEVVASGSVALRGVRPAARGRPRPARRSLIRPENNSHYHDLLEARLAKRKLQQQKKTNDDNRPVADRPNPNQATRDATANESIAPMSAPLNDLGWTKNRTEMDFLCEQPALPSVSPQSPRKAPRQSSDSFPQQRKKDEIRAVPIRPILSRSVDTIDVDAMDTDAENPPAGQDIAGPPRPPSLDGEDVRAQSSFQLPGGMVEDQNMEITRRKFDHDRVKANLGVLSDETERKETTRNNKLDKSMTEPPLLAGGASQLQTASVSSHSVAAANDPSSMSLVHSSAQKPACSSLDQSAVAQGAVKRSTSRKLESDQSAIASHVSLALKKFFGPSGEINACGRAGILRTGNLTTAKIESVLDEDERRENESANEPPTKLIDHVSGAGNGALADASSQAARDSSNALHDDGIPIQRPKRPRPEDLESTHGDQSSSGKVDDENLRENKKIIRTDHERILSISSQDKACVSFRGYCPHCARFIDLWPIHDGTCSSHCCQSRRNACFHRAESALGRATTLVNLCGRWELHPTSRCWRMANIAYRPQPFSFIGTTKVMKFSPFSAVAEAMPGVSSDDVCATCGAGCMAGELLSCLRCPCAFHARCVGETALSSSVDSWLCNACRNANRQLDSGLGSEKGQNLSGALRRLAQEARFGNPLDLALHPSLHLSFVEENGCDWLRCVVCRSPRIVKPGVSSEACRYPFRCSLAFWLPSNERTCGGATSVERSIVSSLEGWIATRSRRRSILFSRYLDEQSRENFGWPPLDNTALLAAEEANAQSVVERKRVRDLSCIPVESRAMDVDLKLGLSKTRPPSSLSNGHSLAVPEPSLAPDSRAVNADKFPCFEQQEQNDGACKSGDPENLRLSGQATQMADPLKPGDVNVASARRGNAVVIIPDDPAPIDARAQSMPVVLEATHGRAPIHSGMASSGPSIVNGVSAPLALQTSAVNKQVATAQMLKRIAQLDFDHDVQDVLVDLAMIPDYRLYIIFSAFKDRPNDLIRQVTRYARRSRTVLSMHETPIPVAVLSQTNLQFPELAPEHQKHRSELSQVQQAMLLQRKQQLAQQPLQMRQHQRETFLQKDQLAEQPNQQGRDNLGHQQNDVIRPQRGHVYQLHQAHDQEGHLHGVTQSKADQFQVHMNGQQGMSRSQVGHQEPHGRAARNSLPQFGDHFQQIQSALNVPLGQIEARRNPRRLQVQERHQNSLQIPPLPAMGQHEAIRHQHRDPTAYVNPGPVRDTGLQEMISQIQNDRFRTSPSNTGQSHDVANVVASLMQRLQDRPQGPGAGS